jgi:hypothetical protein
VPPKVSSICELLAFVPIFPQLTTGFWITFTPLCVRFVELSPLGLSAP